MWRVFSNQKAERRFKTLPTSGAVATILSKADLRSVVTITRTLLPSCSLTQLSLTFPRIGDPHSGIAKEANPYFKLAGGISGNCVLHLSLILFLLVLALSGPPFHQ